FTVPLLLPLSVPVPLTPDPTLFPYTTLFRSVPDAAEAVHAPVLLPPPLTFSVPLWTSTVPLVVKGMLTVVVPVPADFLKVPELLNAADPPEQLTRTASPLESQVPVLLITDPV